MTITEIQNNAKTKMEKTKDVLRGDLMAIRAGRANPQLLDRITVDYYGTPTPLKNVANISRRNRACFRSIRGTRRW